MITKFDEVNIPEDVGYYGEGGAILEGYEKVFIEGRRGKFIVSADLFETIEANGLPWVRPTDMLLSVIGGLPETEAEKLSREKNISVECAQDVLYLRTRSRWSQELEDKLIECHKQKIPVDINSFGVTKETQAKTFWQISQLKVQNT